MKICSLFYPITAATKAEAEDKAAAYEKLPNEMDQLLLLSEALNFDFASKGIDQPFTDDEIAGISGMQTMRDRVVVEEGIKNPTPRDFMQVTGRGLLRNAWVGGPKEIADQIEEWWAGRACDGFVIGPTHQPGSLRISSSTSFPSCRSGEYTARSIRVRPYAITLGLHDPRLSLAP